MRDTRVRVAVAGATGYAGQELVRLLAHHPDAELVAAAASDERPAGAVRALAGSWDRPIAALDVDELARQAQAVFLGLPDDGAARVAPKLVERGVRVFDLSGAFRLRDRAQRERWYPAAADINGLRVAYGLTERYRDEIAEAPLVSCPGCYPTAALLALAPIADLVHGNVFIDAKSGISGAGAKPSARTHFVECHGNVAAYGVFGHRHVPEIEQELARTVTFVPHLVPLNRGILETIYTTLRPGVDATAVSDALRETYENAPFVRLTGENLPEIAHVAHTNYCDIGWRVMGDRIVIVSCLDNLLKGAAGQAVQNFNLAFGLDERRGLA